MPQVFKIGCYVVFMWFAESNLLKLVLLKLLQNGKNILVK